MRSTFKVLFYLKRNAPKKNGLVPVMCRITINGKVAQFSCKLDVEEKSWNVELGRVSGRSIAAQEANRMLDKIRVGINQAYQKIADRDNYVTAEKVRNAYLGLGMNLKRCWRYSVSTTRITRSRWASSKARAAIGNTAPCTNTSRSSSKSVTRSATSPCASLPPRSSPTSSCSSKPRRITATTRSGLI